jgi:hypothetical protein
MLGLQTRHDIQNVSRLVATDTNTRRSNKFIKNLSDAGFSVPGLTNSMRKHTESKQAIISSERRQNLNSKLAQEQFLQKQDEETQNDARKLAELEVKLADIKKQKELRRARGKSNTLTINLLATFLDDFGTYLTLFPPHHHRCIT